MRGGSRPQPPDPPPHRDDESRKASIISSDNYWLVRRHSASEFVPVMGFASDTGRPVIDPQRMTTTYPTPEAALDAVINDWAEYGHSIDPECHLPSDEFDQQVARRKELTDEFIWRIRHGLEDRTVNDVASDLVALAEDWFTGLS